MKKKSLTGVDPMLIEGKYFQPDCLPPVESTDLLFYLVLETSYYTKQQFKAFRSLEAYNQMVVHNPPEKYKIIEHLSQKQFEIIMSPTGRPVAQKLSGEHNGR
ncbi:Hypothetical predicted protein [Paramuricea clavata]|uniref:Uncharacterized protein n=1 Tax=Paramuricea clavata TaxID=317549 RepID=A0A7D9HJ53_PARCT|nr:Hypothetical predicted protein [Paramuricea clavata]